MNIKDYVEAVELQQIDSDDIESDEYLAINPDGLDRDCFMIRIINASNEGVFISYDGEKDNDYVRENCSETLMFQSNSQPINWTAKLKKGTVVYVRGDSGSGMIALAAYYQPCN